MTVTLEEVVVYSVMLPVILLPFTYAVLELRKSAEVAFASLVNEPVTPKMLVPVLMFAALKSVSSEELNVCVVLVPPHVAVTVPSFDTDMDGL